MTTQNWITIGLNVVGWIVIVSTMRERLSSHADRLTKLEAFDKEMPSNYVPRSELNVQVQAIQNSVNDMKGLLQVAVYNGRGVGPVS